MRIEDGKCVAELQKCSICEGNGKREEYIPCPRDRQPQRGKECPHCGTRRKDHHHIKTGKLVHCWSCHGEGERLEDLQFTRIPQPLAEEWWASRDWEVFFGQKSVSFNEQYLGMGYVSACTDYGRLLKRLKGVVDDTPGSEDEKWAAVKVAVREELASDIKGNWPEAFIVSVHTNGYNVRKMIRQADGTMHVVRVP